VTRPILLLRLDGPMQSWGSRSRWDVRESALEPTKSGVIGLIGCALGLRRDNKDLEIIDGKLGFSVRVDRPGILSTDYHTVTGYHLTAAGQYKHGGGTASSLATALEHEESTIISPREYLHDASFLVALSSADNELLGWISGTTEGSPWRGSLQSPFWPVYLGRKSCVPSRPVFERLTDEYENLEDALSREPCTSSSRRSGREVPPKLLAWIESSSGEYERQDAMRINQMRFYDYRRCKRIEIDSSKLRIPERSIS
jgi:CRISPR system Cascade subunit CasD